MKELTCIIKVIKSTNSRLEKEQLLKKHENVPGLKQVLYFIYNPYSTTGISDKKMMSCRTTAVRKGSLEEFLQYFTEHTTGTHSDLEFAWSFINSLETPEEQDLAYSIVTKDLKIGVSEKTLNKVYGANFIPVIGCELGIEYGKAKPRMSGIYISSRKIDGVRRVLVKENGVVRAYSRSGLPDKGIVDILSEAKYLPDNTVYDGELEAIGHFKDNLARRQATSSLANRGGVKTGLMFNIFDIIPVDEFKAGESRHIALVRKRLLDIMFGYQTVDDISPLENLDKMRFITAVPIECVSDNLALHEKVFHRLVSQGEEGLMLIKADSKYKVGKRTYDWVKMKNYMSINLYVSDVFEGSGKYKGKLGGVYVSYKGQLVGIGSGFTDSEREYYWNHLDEIHGRVIRVMCQGESVDSSTGAVSLNCGIFKGFAEEDAVIGVLSKIEGE